MKRVITVLAAIALVAFLTMNASKAVAFSLDPEQIRQALAAALHSEDPGVKKAVMIIQAKGLLKAGVTLQDITEALKDPEVRRAAEYLQKKGILPNVPLPKASMTLPAAAASAASAASAAADTLLPLPPSAQVSKP